jgi:aspartyl-tRNA(Asn)/glutamyl-tRNA(Gln) amidotransferase subunit A
MKPPRIRGPALRAARVAAETPASDALIREIMKRGLGIDALPGLPEAMRGDMPIDAKPLSARKPVERPPAPAPAPAPAWPRAASAFAAAYRERQVTPRAVAERAIAALAELAARRPSMNILVASDAAMTLAEADAATARIAGGVARGALDGVPFLVKDEFDVAGFATTLGSKCGPPARVDRDSTVVARLRAAGAVFVGKTVLTEWGMSPIGGNVNQAMPHNAHDPTRAPGGSSTGSAVGVAIGVAPLAAGGDGGGSIRIPSSLNGIFGIKPTFGRVSRAGDGFKGSVAHAGPLGASTWDLALFLDAVASAPDPLDEITGWAPPPPHGGFGSRLGAGVRGLKIGVDDDAWSLADAEVAAAGRAALAALERDGAELVRVSLPLARHAAAIGYLTIAPESLAAHRAAWLTEREKIGDDVRLAFAVTAGFSALEQLDAQRLRAGLRREVAETLARVDLLALPTTAITAPAYTEDDAKSSFSDAAAIDGLCRYCFLGNLTGLPAATAPVGLDARGLPIGLQIIGDAWDEAGVLAVLAHLERTEVARARRPPGAIDLL